MHIRSRALAFTAAASLLLSVNACASTDSEPEPVAVVATTTVLGDVVSAVTGGAVDVETLLPIGADPHDFQASNQQIAALQSANLVVANGLGLEESLADVIEGLDDVEVLTLGPELDPLPFDESGGLDPHVWLDPVRMADATSVLADTLERVLPDGEWDEPATEYRRQLLDTHDRIVEILSSVPEDRRVLVTNHDSLEYFAQRYGFEVVGTVIPGGSTLADPSSAELAALVRIIRERQIPAIFADALDARALTDVLAAELGSDVEVVELYTGSLGGPGSGAETLIDMLLHDAEAIATALAP